MSPDDLRLIAITDDLRDGIAGLVDRAAAVVQGGATMVQVRLKHADARTLVEVSRAIVGRVSVPVIVNDRADVALAAGAAGVHLGDDDLPVLAVRAFAPPPFIIGATLSSEADIENARQADYVGIGSVYGTRSKRDAGIPIGIEGLERLLGRAVVPAVGIGGVTPENAGAVMRAGAVGIAAVSVLFGADHPAHAARALRSAIGR